MTIIMQILALQLSYYASLSLCIIVVDLFAGLRPHMAQIFYHSSFNLSAEHYGYATLIAHILNIPFVVLAEAAIVEKAIKCLDYTLTIVLYQLVFMWLLYGFPGWTHLNWWLINGAIVTVTCLLSEMLCMKLETAEIKLSVDDLIESGKKVKEQIITAVESSGSRQSMPASKMKRIKKKSSSVTSSGTKHTDSNIKQVKHEV